MKVFDIAKEASSSSVSCWSPEAEDAYVPFIVNRFFSLHTDSLMYANKMNQYAFLPSEIQYDFYRLGLRNRNRFSKWPKAIKETDEEKMIQDYFGYSRSKAVEALKVLTEEQIQKIKESADKGGV